MTIYEAARFLVMEYVALVALTALTLALFAPRGKLNVPRLLLNAALFPALAFRKRLL